MKLIELLKTYKDKIMEKTVKTIKSELMPKHLCRKIDGEFYKIGNRNQKNSGDCYKINGRYYKDSTGYIIFDHFNQRYEINSVEKFTYGVIGVKEDKETLIKGSFLRNDLVTIVSDKDSILHKVMNYSILDNTNYILDRNKNKYIHKDNYSLLSLLNYKAVDNNFKRSLNYNITPAIIEQCEYLFEEYKDKLPTYKVAEPLAKYLDGLSFGLEFETTKGTIPKKYCYANGVVPLRDGSIEGLEYVTLPLQEKEGINSIMNITKLLNEYTTFDNTCSLHMHIGNIPRTESFLLALFKVLCNVENEFYQMFPLYKQINGGYKKKNYTSPLPAVSLLSQMDAKITDKNMKANFGLLFQYLSNGVSYSQYNYKLENVNSHPYDPDNNRKWNVASRYHWVNLIPLIFGNKQTIEFRIHTPAKDPNKILMFLLLTSKLINFVKTNEDSILENKFTSIDLNTILASKHTSLKFENKLNNVIRRYKNTRIGFTNSEYSKNNFNYDEKDFKFTEPTNFVNEYGTSFLFNEKDTSESIEDMIRDPDGRISELYRTMTVSGRRRASNPSTLTFISAEEAAETEDEDYELETPESW